VDTSLHESQIRLDADIIPDQSLGGITLRSNISDLKDQLIGLGTWKPGSFELVTCKDVAGLAMEIPEIDPLPETVPDMNIESIICIRR
jgi:hypothetical protein